MAAIVMAEEYWRNSMFSIDKYYGGMKLKIDGENVSYTIVNKEGKTLLELSEEAEKEGRHMAIEPGEPADLVDNRYIPIYRELGRNRFLAMIENEPIKTPEQARKLVSKYKKMEVRDVSETIAKED